MKVEIKTPKGYRKVPAGFKPKIGDWVFSVEGCGRTDLRWRKISHAYECEEKITKRELVIRCKRAK